VGSPVNIAARICAQAGPGEVLVSETVRALTTTVLPVQFKSRGRRQLKGIADPIELFAVEEAGDGATPWPARGRRRLSRRARAALVGGMAIAVAAAVGIGWFASQPVGFDANGDSTQKFVSMFRVDPEAADGAGDWVLVKQQDFGPPQ
jgi:hypothetical protein